MNSEVTNVTALQILAATKETEAGWARRRAAMGWSVDLVGQARIDEMRYEYAKCMYRYWESFRIYELCSSLYRRTNDTVIERDAIEFPNTSVWHAFHALAQKRSDLRGNLHFTRTVHAMYELFKALRFDFAEFLPKLLIMCIASAEPFAKSRLCEGLGTYPIIKKVGPQEVANLLSPMKNSQATKSLEGFSDIKEVVEKGGEEAEAGTGQKREGCT